MEKQPKILIDIYNLVLDIRNILIKVHKGKICSHRALSDKVEYWTDDTKGEEGTVHKCITCGQLINVPRENQTKEV